MRITPGTVRSCPLPWLPALSHIQPLYLRRKASTDKLVAKALLHPEWGFHKDLTCHPPERLKSKHPLWEDILPTDIAVCWKEDWWSTNVVNSTLVEDSGFLLPRHLCFRTGQGPCKACLKKWGLASSDLCECGGHQTMSHIVDSCPNITVTGGSLPCIRLMISLLTGCQHMASA